MTSDPLFSITVLLIVCLIMSFIAIFFVIRAIKKVDRLIRFMQIRDSLRVTDDDDQG